MFGEAGARAGCASVRAGAGARRAWGVAWALGLGAHWLAAAGRAGGWGAGDVGADWSTIPRQIDNQKPNHSNRGSQISVLFHPELLSDRTASRHLPLHVSRHLLLADPGDILLQAGLRVRRMQVA